VLPTAPFAKTALLIAALWLAMGAGVPPPAINPSVIDRLFDDDERAEFAVPRPGSYALPVIKPAAGGEVLTIDGRTVRLEDYVRGKITILSFIYTLCSDARGCPLAMATLYDLHDASARLPAAARKVRLVTLSFDPRHDTPEAMKSYAMPVLADRKRSAKMPWHFLTTASPAKIAPILEAYGQVVDRSGGEATINHLLRLYLVDRHGDIRNIYGLGLLDPRLLFADVLTLLMEQTAKPAKPH